MKIKDLKKVKLRRLLISALYRVNIFTHEEVTSKGKIIAIIVSLAGLLYTYFSNQLEIKILSYTALFIFAGYVFIKFLTEYLIQNVVKNGGGLYPYASLTYFNQDKRVLSLKLDQSIILDKAEKAQANEIAKFLVEAYRDTLWHKDEGEAQKQVEEHIEKNTNSVQFINYKVAEEIQKIGLTYIVPVNHNNWNNYKEGHINDDKLRGENIVSSDKRFIDNVPFGLIVFSTIITKRPTNTLTDSEGSRFLEEAVSKHIEIYFKEDFKHYLIVPVLFQNMRADLIKLFAPHQTNGRNFSKDRARIVCIEIANNNYQPLPEYALKA